MSKSWKCTICGSTMLSKCPSQRSIFMSPTESILNSILTVNKVMPLKNDSCAELFISYTTGAKEKTTGQMVQDLITLLSENPNYLQNLGCSHHWVLNSETETECTLGCTHANLLTPVPEYVEDAKPTQTLDNYLKEYGTIINIAIEQARLGVNISKQAYDIPVEEDFNYMKDSIRHQFAKIMKGEHLKKAFRVRVPGKTWRDPDFWCYFDTETEAVRYALGCRMTDTHSVEIDKIDANNERYETFTDWKFEYTCRICGDIKDDIFVITSDGDTVHHSCYKDSIDKVTVKKRKTAFELPDGMPRWHSAEEIKEKFELIDCWYGTRRRNSPEALHIEVKADAKGLQDIVDGILYYIR